jgi:hypothetical protein
MIPAVNTNTCARFGSVHHNDAARTTGTLKFVAFYDAAYALSMLTQCNAPRVLQRKVFFPPG